MKLVGHFKNFLKETVNLNPSRITLLEDRVAAVEGFLRNSDYQPRINYFSSQGSWAHKTIIKPKNGKEFDADHLVFIDEVEDWTAADYVNELIKVFKDNGTYTNLVKPGTRCATLDYAGDFHIDLVPCIRRVEGNECTYWICSRRDDTYEQTEPELYTKWFAEHNRITGNNMLRKVTRLLKYLRDIKATFSVKSILLTTLLGDRINDWDEDDRNQNFIDIPTALKTIVGRLDDFLQENPKMPVVENPALPTENFNRHWDQRKYDNFRSKIYQYREWIDDAYDESDRDESIRKWQRVFGDEFAKGENLAHASSTTATSEIQAATSADIWLPAIRRSGPSVLAQFPNSLPHVAPPPWNKGGESLPVSIRAELFRQRGADLMGPLQSGQIIKSDCSIRFEAKIRGSFIPDSFSVEWRVVNTGEDAEQAQELRGYFCESDPRCARWESTKYKGIHWVEAFVVNTRTGLYVGTSERFFVVIGQSSSVHGFKLAS